MTRPYYDDVQQKASRYQIHQVMHNIQTKDITKQQKAELDNLTRNAMTRETTEKVHQIVRI